MGDDAQLVVIDASVAVKWFLSDGESGVDSAAVLLAQHAEGQVRLISPALIAHELMGVFVRRLRGPAVADALDAFFDAGVHLVTPDRELMALAAGLALRCQVSAFDSAYAAVAESLGCALATSDRRLANALEATLEIRAV